VSASSEHRPSIREVAKRAGVATSTVSRVMNSHIDVSPRMRERVGAAVRDLGYRPDILAQGLRTKTTRAIGVIVSDIADPLLAAAVAGVERRLRAAGYAVYLASLERDAELDLESIRLLAQRRVDGLILGLSEERNPAAVELLRAANVPLVLLDRDLPRGVRASRAVFDHASGMQRATRTLLDMGHREIALIVGDAGRSAHERERAVLQAVSGAVSGCHCRVFSGEHTAEFGGQATRQLLDSASAPTALIAGGRLLLHGALRVCHERGLRLGIDLSLIGCDDDDLADLHDPPIAAIVSDPVAIGMASAELVLEILDGAPAARDVALPTEFVLRASCGPPRRDR
jgi:LacI family transcriptional regulator